MIMGIWAVTDSPSDMPGMFVARRWIILPGNPEPQHTDQHLAFADLEVLHEFFAGTKGYIWLPREPCDDPVIVGSYME